MPSFCATGKAFSFVVFLFGIKAFAFPFYVQTLSDDGLFGLQLFNLITPCLSLNAKSIFCLGKNNFIYPGCPA
jgi:hypothetical protein